VRQTAGLRICIWHMWQACLQPYRHNSLVQHGQGLGQRQALGCLKTVPQHSCTCTVRSVNVQQAAAASLTSNSSGPRKADTALEADTASWITRCTARVCAEENSILASTKSGSLIVAPATQAYSRAMLIHTCAQQFAHLPTHSSPQRQRHH